MDPFESLDENQDAYAEAARKIVININPGLYPTQIQRKYWDTLLSYLAKKVPTGSWLTVGLISRVTIKYEVTLQ